MSIPTGTIIEVEQIRGGQIRPYGDSHYDANITITGPSKHLPGEKKVMDLSKVLVREWSHDCRLSTANSRLDEDVPWHATRLKRLTHGVVTHDAEADTYQQVWAVHIVQPSTH